MRAPDIWPMDPLVSKQGGEETYPALDDLDEESADRLKQMAIELLWSWTGRKYGLTETVVRPCREAHRPSAYGFLGTSGNGWAPALIDGSWHNLTCGACPRGRCACDDRSAFHLALPGPVHEVISVVINGQELPQSAYRLSRGVLTRLDGQPWPMSNDDTASLSEPGTWEVTYERGYPAPVGGQLAAYHLAGELALALAQDQHCRLPQRVQSITREGVTMSILDGFEGLEDGKTGIWEIDAWIASVNQPRPIPSRVYSPDIPRERGTSRSRAVGYAGRR